MRLASFTLLTLCLPLPAYAQCANDMDCKGDRICVDNACADPTTEATSTTGQPARTPATVTTLTDVDRMELERARSKAGTALGLAAGTVLFGVATAATNNGDPIAPQVLGTITLGLSAVATPIAAGGGKQARRIGRSMGLDVDPDITTVTGWTGYGIGMGLGTVVLAAGLPGAYIDSGLILSLTALGSASAMAMSFDTKAVVLKVEEAGASARIQQPRVQTRFVAGLHPDGGGTIGWVGTF
mgnify:CR=1 FL=1